MLFCSRYFMFFNLFARAVVVLRMNTNNRGKYLIYITLNNTQILSVCLISSLTTPFTQLLQTRVCFTNAGINTYGAEIHKVRKHAIHAFPLFLFLTLLFRHYVKEPF